MLLSKGSSCDEFESNCALPSGEKARAACRFDEGSNTEGVVICGLILLVVLVFALEGFSIGALVSLVFQNQQFHIPTRLGMWLLFIN